MHKTLSPQTSPLHELIEALTASERRYLTIQIQHQLKKENSFALKTLAELVRGKMTRIKIGTADQSYLWDFTMEVLRKYNSNKTIQYRINERIANATILIEKRLYEDSLSELIKAERLARDYDQTRILLDILIQKIQVITERQSKTMLKEIESISSDIEKVSHEMTLDAQLRAFRSRSFVLLRSSYTSLQQSQLLHTYKKEIEKITIPKGNLNLLTHFESIQAIHASIESNFSIAFEAYDRIIDAWEKRPERIKDDSISFKKILANAISTAHSFGRFDLMPSLLEKIQSIPCRTSEEEAEQFQNVYFMKLLHLMNTNGFDHLDDLVAEIENGLITYKTKINKAREIAFAHNIGMSYLLLHDWKKALHWIERIIKQEKTEHRQDLQHTARMLRLLLWYEFGKHDLLEYELINVERFLRKRKAWFAYESTVVKFFGKLLLLDGSAKTALIQKFKTQLETAVEGKTSAALPGSSELMYWAQSQVTGKSMRDLLVEETVHVS